MRQNSPPPTGDVEMQPTAAAAAQEAAAAKKKAAEEKARTSSGSSASSALPPPTPGYETAKGRNALPPAVGKEAADAPLADSALTTINGSQSAQL